MMNLQRDAYLMEYHRRLMANEHNHKETLPQPTSRLETRISNGLRRLGQIRGIHIHISFDWKEPSDNKMRHVNA